MPKNLIEPNDLDLDFILDGAKQKIRVDSILSSATDPVSPPPVPEKSWAHLNDFTRELFVWIPAPTAAWVPACPSGAATQYVTSTTTYCALIDGVGYSAGDTITVTYIVDPTAIPGPAHVTRYLNISTGPGAPFYLNVDGVDLIGVEPNQTDFGQCSGCTDCADVPAGSVV